MNKTTRLWDKGQPINDQILAFTVGNDPILDQRLIPYDITASIAHAQMLGEQNHLTQEEVEKLTQALEELRSEDIQISRDEEDCHTAIENRLTQKLGDLGGKIHLGRSRNDQVLTALRLYYRQVIVDIHSYTKEAMASLIELSHNQGEIKIPGYTHLQQAMPSSVSLWAMGYTAELNHSLNTFAAAEHLISLNPLGSAAGFGTPGLTLNRESTTKKLGFTQAHEPVTAPQLSRGKAESALAFSLCLIMQDLGRLAADLCLYNSQEFAMVTLADDITTGSSIMPQKRNPDVFELIRGHSAQAPAELQAIQNITLKMTSGYHRDLQLIKEPLFRLIDRTHQTLQITTYALTRITFNAERATQITDPSIHAAEAAFALVQTEKISFREAYRRIAAN
ncbi:argininosuccinate lyase [bacterium]|nr:argininosuccinate lyase [bacterium]